MIAIINPGQTIRGALSYNEEKVKEGQADLLLAVGFGCEAQELGFTQKLRRFQHLISNNPHVKTNTVHAILSFPAEEQLSADTLQSIAMDYMEQIGFGEQPYLVYQHRDTAHPHLHIVTTNVQSDGSYISLHNIGRDLSEPARQAIEQEYGLIRAQGRRNHQQPENTEQIVNYVLQHYRPDSMDMFTTILRSYRVEADCGTPESRTRLHRGILYHRLSAAGAREGIPVKASRMSTKPTLDRLEQLFIQHQLRPDRRNLVENRFNAALRAVGSQHQLIAALRERRMELQQLSPTAYGPPDLWVVDHQLKAAYRLADLHLPALTAGQKLSSRAAQRKARQEEENGVNLPVSSLPAPGQAAAPLRDILLALLQSTPGGGGGGLTPPHKKKKKKRP